MDRNMLMGDYEVARELVASAWGLSLLDQQSLLEHGLVPVAVSDGRPYLFKMTNHQGVVVPWPSVRYLARLPFSLRAEAGVGEYSGRREVVLPSDPQEIEQEDYVLLDMKRVEAGCTLVQVWRNADQTFHKVSDDLWRFSAIQTSR